MPEEMSLGEGFNLEDSIILNKAVIIGVVICLDVYIHYQASRSVYHQSSRCSHLHEVMTG